MPLGIVFGSEFAINGLLGRWQYRNGKTMNKKKQKTVCGKARRVSHVSVPRKLALCVSKLLLEMEDVCHV